MERVLVRSEELKKSLAHIIKFIPQKPIKQVLSCVRLRFTEDVLFLDATDMSSFLTKAVYCSNEYGEKSILVEANDFYDLVKNFKNNSEVYLEVEGSQLKIFCNSNKISIPSMPSDNFPALKDQKHEFFISVSASSLQDAIRRLVGFCSTDGAEFNNAIKFSRVNDNYMQLEVFGTFGYSNVLIDLGDEILEKSFGLSKNIAESLCLFLADIEDVVDFSYSQTGTTITIKYNDDRIVMSENNSEFPDSKKVFANEAKASALLLTEDFTEMMKIASKVTKNAVSVEIGDDSLSVSAQSQDKGKYESKAEGKTTGSHFKILLYPNDIVNILSKYSGKSCYVEVSETNKPVILKDLPGPLPTDVVLQTNAIMPINPLAME